MLLHHHHHLKQLLHRRTTVVNVRRNLDERLLKKMEHVLSLGGPSPIIRGPFSAHRQQADDRISSLIDVTSFFVKVMLTFPVRSGGNFDLSECLEVQTSHDIQNGRGLNTADH